MVGPVSCHQIGEARGAALGTPVAVGADLVLDDRWTDDVKAVVFEMLPDFAAWVSDEAKKLSAIEAEAEADLGKI